MYDHICVKNPGSDNQLNHLAMLLLMFLIVTKYVFWSCCSCLIATITVKPLNSAIYTQKKTCHWCEANWCHLIIERLCLKHGYRVYSKCIRIKWRVRVIVSRSAHPKNFSQYRVEVDQMNSSRENQDTHRTDRPTRQTDRDIWIY